MKRILKVLFVFLISLTIVSCNASNNDDGRLKVITSFTIIEDMVKQIGGDKVSVYNLVPSGVDPHEYEPLPKDLKKVSDADILLYNGMNLEGGENGWFFKMARTANKKVDVIYNLSASIEPLYLSEEGPRKETVNPHTFLSPKLGIIIIQNVIEALVDADGENEEYYRENGDRYMDILVDIELTYSEGFAMIPVEKRVMVTSERAFQYLAADYNIEEHYIWLIDTEETGTPEQMTKLINYLRANPVSYLFLESNVKTEPMETVSNETGIPIFHKRVYADEVGKKGSVVDTYVKLLEYNLSVFLEGMI